MLGQRRRRWTNIGLIPRVYWLLNLHDKFRRYVLLCTMIFICLYLAYNTTHTIRIYNSQNDYENSVTTPWKIEYMCMSL